MIGNVSHSAFLRQAFVKALEAPVYPLVPSSEVFIGRDPRCQIVFDSQKHGGVSRHHAKVCPIVAKSGDPRIQWQVCDLQSANGTYVNDQRVQACQILQSGDRITLGQNGPEFIFEVRLNSPVHLPPLPPPAVVPPSVSQTNVIQPPLQEVNALDPLTLSQLLPILSTGRDLTRKAYLIPAVITIFFVVLLFVAIGSTAFNVLLAAYMAGGTYYFVYQLCGKNKPWWLLAGAASLTMLLVLSPVLSVFTAIFRGILPGAIPENLDSISFPVLFIRMFFGAGLMEELIKALPVFLTYYIGTKLRSPEQRERIGVWEPLDGILLGTASAIGFTLLETLGQYVPMTIDNVTLQAGASAGELAGLQLLIARILGSVAGHMAYSGYFGYFIGLSVLKPSKRWQILAIGYFSAALLHTLWNASGIINALLLGIVGTTSYAFLAAAILKARAISPTRSQNFATRFS